VGVGILKRLFSKKTSNEDAPQEPNPEPVSPPQTKDSENPTESVTPCKLTARAPRIPIGELHRIGFTLDPADPWQRMAIANVSVTGIGFLKAVFKVAPSKEDILGGVLTIEDRGYPVKIRIAYVSEQRVGALFQEAHPDLRKALETYFKIELAALGTMKINPQYHKSEPDGITHWIHGDTGELYYVSRADRVLRFHMTFLGNHFVGDQNKQLAAGHVTEEREHDELRKGTELVEMAERVSDEMNDLALKFISNVPHLSAEHRNAIEAMIRKR
jgi:hypothetical protein